LRNVFDFVDDDGAETVADIVVVVVAVGIVVVAVVAVVVVVVVGDAFLKVRQEIVEDQICLN
jgi:hypothetical protein